MDLQTILTFALAVFALAVKPGPGMMTVISRTLSHGMMGCYSFLLAVCLVSYFYLGLVLAGLKFAQEDLLFVSILLKSCAAVYLIYLGVKGLMNPDVELKIDTNKEQKLFEDFTGFVMLTLSNPLVIVFYGGLVPSLLDVSTIGFSEVITLAAVITVVECAVAITYCLPFALSRNFLTPEILKRVTIGSSIVLILVGLYIGYSALPAMDVVSVVQ
jgi:threonine/homoserine/homoserine lactone efflux protein